MGKKIVCVGRGGVGKTSFVSGLCFSLKEHNPLLVIDADPDESLAQFLGIDSDFNTVSSILFNIKEGRIQEMVKNFSLPEKIDYLIQSDGLYEADFFDFLSLGVKWTQGCYCQPNNILKEIMNRLEKNYNFILIDSPAGLEHINRRVTNNLDYLFILIDPSKKAFDSIVRFRKLLEEINISFKDIFILANHRFSPDDLGLVKEKSGFDVLDILPYDKEVEKLNLEGKSFQHLDKNCLFLKKIREVLNKAKIL